MLFAKFVVTNFMQNRAIYKKVGVNIVQIYADIRGKKLEKISHVLYAKNKHINWSEIRLDLKVENFSVVNLAKLFGVTLKFFLVRIMPTGREEKVRIGKDY